MERDPLTQDETKCTLGDIGSEVNQESQTSSKSATLIAMIDISVMTRSDAASTKCAASHLGHQISEPMSHNIQTSYSKGAKPQRKKQVCDIPPTCPRCKTPNAKLNPHINNTFLTSTECRTLDSPQVIYQHLTSAGEIVSNLPQGQMAWQNTPGGGRIGPRRDRPLGLGTDETAGAETAPLSIHYTILTPGETLLLVVILAGVLIVAGILPTILKLTGIPIGILVLFKILARILSLAETLIWGESKSQSGRQARTEFPPRDAKVDQAKETLLATEVEDV